MILLNAKALTLTLSGYRCYLDGKYIVCLNIDDTLTLHGGYYEADNLSFRPYFYNINLNHDLIGMEMYNEMRAKYGYPDFRLFRMRGNDYFGIISISDEEYATAKLFYDKAKRDIESSINDVMWSCRARSDIISVLHIAEGAYLGKQMGLEHEILRYIYDNINARITLEDICLRFKTNRTTVSNLIKEKTGLPPMKYVLETKLEQSRPDLLFTQLPINEIAEKYGFSDANYYIRAFKKRFGKSPLQFRKEGWNERIRDEGIYQRRAELERTDMTVKDFCEFYKKGLGRAVTRLKLQSDKEPYKEALAEMLLNVEKRGHHRFLDIYEKELLDVINDKEFTKRIVDGLLFKLSEENKYQNCIPLLLLLGYRGRVEEIVERRYRESYEALLEYTKKPWDGEKYPPFAETYMSMASTLGKYLKMGDERIKSILFDIADLYDYSDAPVIPTYRNPLYSLWDGVGRECFFLILDEAIKEHRNGKCIDIRNEFVGIKIRGDVAPPSFDEIKNFNFFERNGYPLYAGFRNADKETIEAVAKAAIEEEDIDKKMYYLNYFTFRMLDYPPVEFPFDPEPLIKLAEAENYEIRTEQHYGYTPIVLEILANKRCPASHRVGVKLFFDNSVRDWLRIHAILVRFGKNYIPGEDRSDLTALLRSENPDDKSTAIRVFTNDLKLGIEGLPLDMIPYIFANIEAPYTHLRKELVEALVEKCMLPDEIRDECAYDADKKIREMFLKS